MSAEVNFWTRYSSLCSKSKVCPLRSIFRRLKGTELCCPVEVIRSEHWPLLLAALSTDSSLTKLQFASDLYPVANQEKHIGEKKRRSGLQFPIPYGCSEKNVSDICRCVAHLLCTSRELKILKIENLCLKEEDALILEKAFKDSSVEHFSISGCKLQDDAFQIICRGLQSSNVQWIDFSSCEIQAPEMFSVCKIIKAHNLRRSSELFPHTLRYQLPILDDIKGLRRITLNNNKIGDEAVEMLVGSFCEDFWIKALDLQKCCIGNDGAKSILNVAKRNAGLQLIDLRLNDIDENIMNRIALQIALNNVGKVVEHDLGCLWKPSKNIKRISCRKAYLKTKVLKYSPPKGRALSKESARVPFKIRNSKTTSEEASSQTSTNYNNELKKPKKIIAKYNNLVNMLKKYKKENYLLHQEVENLSSQDDYMLIDHQTFTEVTSTFEKFKKFLDIMKEYGLWECIAMLEENESSKNILRPLITEYIKQCIKIVKSDSSSERISQSNDSVPLSSLENEMVLFQKQFEHFNNHKQVDQSQTKSNNNITESKLFYSRVLPEMNYVKKPMPSDKALVHKVFREVVESYTSSSHSSDRIKSMPQPPKPLVHSKQRSMSHISRIKSSISETATKLQQLNSSKGLHSGIFNNHDQSVTYPKTVKSPSASMHGTNDNTQKSIVKVGSGKTSGNAFEPIAEISLSSSKSFSDGSSTLRKSNKAESDQSSVYKSLPEVKQKTISLPDNDVDIGLPSEKHSIVTTTSKSNTKFSSPSENQTSLESGNPKSSRTSKSKISSHKSKSAASSRKHISVSKHSIPDVPSNKVLESSSSASSVNSYSGKNSIKESVHSSVEGINSEKSYLESVSEASTDKDVKSLSESEVYSSDRSKKDSKVSIQTKHVPKKESSVPPAEMHSELKKAVHSNSTKSSETKLTQKKASGGKPEKDNKSESSVPSLSDITTVSSHSLNTDSVMGQLSDD